MRDRLQAAAIGAGIWLLRRLGPVAASNLGGAVARTVGPWLPVSRVAHDNLAHAMPELDSAARHRVVRGVWDNLGRTAAELPHLRDLHRIPTGAGTGTGPGWECLDDTTLAALQTTPGAAILFTGHLANWEIGFPVAAAFGLDVSWFYRPATNAWADRVIQSMRHGAVGAPLQMFAKGRAGAMAALKHLRGGGRLGMMVDQKLNEGVAVPFFGRPAMTTTAVAAFAVRLRCPVIPIHVVRLGPARFRVICEPPMPLPATGDTEADILTLTTAINQTLEGWIRAQPEAWLWLHRRWPKSRENVTPPPPGAGAQAG